MIRLMMIVLLAAIAGATLHAQPALAQSRCQALWFERNEIYARNGFCFRTQRAIAEFGRACFPPYGKLGGWEARRVRDIEAEENYLGCPR